MKEKIDDVIQSSRIFIGISERIYSEEQIEYQAFVETSVETLLSVIKEHGIDESSVIIIPTNASNIKRIKTKIVLEGLVDSQNYNEEDNLQIPQAPTYMEFQQNQAILREMQQTGLSTLFQSGVPSHGGTGNGFEALSKPQGSDFAYKD